MIIIFNRKLVTETSRLVIFCVRFFDFFLENCSKLTLQIFEGLDFFYFLAFYFSFLSQNFVAGIFVYIRK